MALLVNFRRPLLLSALLVACNGRVKIGTELTSAGAGGDSGAPSDTEAGSAGDGGAQQAPSWLQVLTQVGSGPEPLPGVSFLNLADPASELISFDDHPNAWCPFSPDGRFACVSRKVDSSTQEVFLVDAAGPKLGAPRSLGLLGADFNCSWSPNSDRLLCLGFSEGAPRLSFLSPAGNLPLMAVPFERPPSGSLTWVRDGSLLFTDDSGELIRIEWAVDGSARSMRTGLRGVLVQFANARDLAVLAPWDAPAGEPNELLDLVTLAHAPLPASSMLSPSFRSLVGIEAQGSMEDPDAPRTYSYFRVNGVRTQLVDTRQRVLSELDRESLMTLPPQFAGELFAEVRDGRLTVTNITADAVSTREVPGDYQEPSDLAASADGRWLSFVALEAAVGDRRPRSRWLVRLDEGSVRSAAKLPQFTTVTHANFSPDSAKLIVSMDPVFVDVTTPRESAVLFHLGASVAVEQQKLDAACDWNRGVWSPDSAFFALLGITQSNSPQSPLQVVNALDGTMKPRLILSCNPETAPELPCPYGFLFQR